MRKRDAWVLLGAAAASAVTWAGLDTVAKGATSQPADKVAAAGSTRQVVGPGENVVLLTEVVKTSTPADTILSFTGECALTTNLKTVGTDDASASGSVKVWITIDGKPVPVSADDTTDPGQIVLCNRAVQRKTTFNQDDQDNAIETFENTREANGFNWLALNLGNGTHEIKVMATLEQSVSSADQTALAVVGKRTLIIEPIHTANGQTIEETPPTTASSGGSTSGLPIIGG